MSRHETAVSSAVKSRLQLPPIIGFGHRKRVGKDTAAEILVQKVYDRQGHTENVRKCAFADKLKDVAHQLYGWAGLMPGAWYEIRGNAEYRDKPLEAIGKTPREIWIDLGTPAIRKSVFDGTWVEYLLQTKKPNETYIISDVRFPNEAQRIHECGGILVKIDNPRVPATRDVADEALASYPFWDWTITNEGTIDDLSCEIGTFLDYFEAPCE